jgi:hypothetical protein
MTKHVALNRRMAGYVALGFLALGAGCSRKTPPKQARQVPGSAAIPAVGAEPAWVHGLLVMRKGLQTFHACDDTLTYWVEDEAGDLGFAFEQIGTGPDRPVFAEILVAAALPPVTGPGSTYPRAVVATGLRLAAFASEDGGCDAERASYEFRARGNEPFWSVTITRQEIIFAQPDDPTRVAFPVRAVAGGRRQASLFDEHRDASAPHARPVARGTSLHRHDGGGDPALHRRGSLRRTDVARLCDRWRARAAERFPRRPRRADPAARHACRHCGVVTLRPLNYIKQFVGHNAARDRLVAEQSAGASARADAR